MQLHWMALSALLMYLAGYIGAMRLENRNVGGWIGIIALVLIMGHGGYWNLFGRGEGFFTANRISAFVVLFAVHFAGIMVGSARLVRDRMAAGRWPGP